MGRRRREKLSLACYSSCEKNKYEQWKRPTISDLELDFQRRVRAGLSNKKKCENVSYWHAAGRRKRFSIDDDMQILKIENSCGTM